MRATKIVATVGPASSSLEVIREMVKEGVNVMRLNFSHGVYDDHAAVVNAVRKVDAELGTNTALLADLQGPKIRVGAMTEGALLVDGAEFEFRVGEGEGCAEYAYTAYPDFAGDVKPGEPVLLDDGKLRLEVLSTDGKKKVTCRVIHGGLLSSRKGINLPNTEISLPSLTEKDCEDLDFALSIDVDWIGLSFVRSAQDITDLRAIINGQQKHARIVAKIEKLEAVEQLQQIVHQTDAVMVARGDLGVEVPMERVPLIQKRIIELCLRGSKPVIVATQMMESMIENIAPTRAEVNDVANAVLDGADAVMLSGETSVGQHPVEVIRAMRSIIEEVEKEDHIYYSERPPAESESERFISDHICYNACRLAKRTGARAIITMSYSGYTAYKVSGQRPRCPIIVFTGNKAILGQVSLAWGVTAYPYTKMISTDHTISDVKRILYRDGRVVDGDLIIHIASMPIGESGMTNMLKLDRI